MKRLLCAALFAALSFPLSATAHAQPATPAAAPSFTFDANWMQLPPEWITGDFTAVAIDRNDNVWVMHRPRTVNPLLLRFTAPPVMEFDSTGKFIRGWGGPGAGYDWPANEHSLFVDAQDRVWLTGNNRPGGDNFILQFTMDGKFVRQIGAKGATQGDLDTKNVNLPADLYVDVGRRDLYVADGYGNRRVIVFDTQTGAFKRMWGAFGDKPPSTPATPAPPAVRPPGSPPETGEGQREFRTVHGVEVARDGTVYVSDRDNGRVQVFDRNGKYKRQVFIDRTAANRQTAAGLAISPDQRWLYVGDLGNGRLTVLDRKTLTPAAVVGSQGAAVGQFNTPHLMAVNSKGVLYIAEVQGRRVQKLTPK